MWGIELRRQSQITLSRQIYQAFRNHIIHGRMEPGEALPSTRELAKQLAVSRNTVYEAYEMLLAEGFVISRQGALTRVAEGLHLEYSPDLEQPKEIEEFNEKFKADFSTGKPDLRYFPHTLWNRLLSNTFKSMPISQLGYSGPEGLSSLREEIALWLLRSRGITVDAKSIFITAGSTQALHLLAELLSSEGKEMIIEDPCHVGMMRALQRKVYPMRPVPVDEQGIQTDFLNDNGACAVYVTPSHQFPLGGILPADRRTALIRFARKNDLYIIEDDYDSEFRYCGAPITPLYSLDPQRVIYVGTFSKIVFPALRIGYVILPQQLRKRWRYMRIYTDVQNPPFEQAALAEYLNTRKLDRHVQQMRRLYGQRRQTLLQVLKETFIQGYRVWGDAAGLHLTLEFPDICFDNEFTKRARQYGICITPVEYHSIVKGKHMNKLLLGYGHLELSEIREGILLLHEFLDKYWS